MAGDVILETHEVSKVYRRGGAGELRALQGVSVAIPRGSLVALTGPSGSGKTTLLALLGALERPSSGRVLFQGRELGRLSDVALARTRRSMGFVYQDFSLIPTLTVWENVTYPLIPRGVRRGERLARAGELLGRFGLENRLLARPRELSGGEQQRVALARALAGRPDIMLADEPTSNLDAASGRAVLDALRELHAEGRTVILASHEAPVIALASQVYALDGGKLKGPAS
jgi:putative ABC transport system ATP-binding protein